MFNQVKDFLKVICANEVLIWWIMAAIVLILSQALKQLIKIFTRKISDEGTRECVNQTIILIPVGLSYLILWLYKTFYLHAPMDYQEATLLASSATMIYASVEPFYKKLKAKIKKDTSDGKVTPDEISETVKITKGQMKQLKEMFSEKPEK